MLYTLPHRLTMSKFIIIIFNPVKESDPTAAVIFNNFKQSASDPWADTCVRP